VFAIFQFPVGSTVFFLHHSNEALHSYVNYKEIRFYACYEYWKEAVG
jgi:hypothetical protein